jgi:hypothetical protein
MSLGSARAAGTSGHIGIIRLEPDARTARRPTHILQLALNFPHPSWCGNTHRVRKLLLRQQCI